MPADFTTPVACAAVLPQAPVFLNLVFVEVGQ